MRQILLLAWLVLGGNVAWGQTSGPWTPSTSGTYRLRSRTDNDNFDVYDANGNPTASTNQTSIGQFTITSGTYNIIFENTKTINMTGQIYLNANDGVQAHLIMELGTPPENGTPAPITLKIDNIPSTNGQAVAFFINKKSIADHTQHTITIKGIAPPTGTENISNFEYNFENNFVIDGSGPTLTLVDSATWTPKVYAEGGQVVGSGMFRIQEGSLTLQHVTVQKFSSSYGNANLIQVFPDPKTTPNVTVNLLLDHCYFHQIGAKSSTGSPILRMQTNGGVAGSNIIDSFERKAVIQNCKFEDIFGSYQLAVGDTTVINNANATIRTVGNNMTTLAIYNTHITNNYGCPVRWHGASTNSKLKVYNCRIENNFTCLDANARGGGGLLLKGPAEISNCTIRNNRTQGDGGGIYLSTYTDFSSSTSELVPDHSVLVLDSKTTIENNVAYRNGGGVAIDGIRMKNVGNVLPPNGMNGPDGYLWFAPDGKPFTLRFQLNGGKIKDNEAKGIDMPNQWFPAAEADALGLGGGVLIMRNKQTSYFKIECELDKGEISGNKVTSDTGKGGGVAIYSPNAVDNPNNMPNHVKPQNVDVIIGIKEATEQVLIKNNTASDGGGIYVNALPITYHGVTSTVSTNVYDYSTIDNNTATTGSGGGLYLANGSVTITNESRVGAYSPTLKSNKANADTGLGGGIFLGNGDINMEGATIGGSTEALGNSAGVSGGGIYVNSGSVTMLSTTIRYNKAMNGSGGGMYLGGGNVSINPNEIGTGIRSSISNNTAGQHGGGVYTADGKLIAYGSFSENTTQDNFIQITNNTATTGNGGGIYCNGSSDPLSGVYDIRLRRVTIGNNVAGQSGGGVYLNEGKISIIAGSIKGNTATENGGGVFTQLGDIDINVTRDERVNSEILNNTAGRHGGGLTTYAGFIRIFGNDKDHRIRIANNVASAGSGGGMLCRGLSETTEYITLRHVDLINNKAVSGTGGVINDIVFGCGGGMYLQLGKISITDVNLQNNYANWNGGGINNHEGSIDVDGCYVGSSHSDGGEYWYKDGVTYNPASTNNDTDRGNKAGNNGGGIYTHKGDIDIEDYVETSGNIFREESKITFNEAGKNGGGINTHMGTISINTKEEDDQIEVSFNKAERGGGMYANAGTIIVYNTLIHDNTATLHGGGANNHSGDIVIYGGVLSNNTAEEGHGGGAYTNVGDIDLFQFPSTELQNATLNHGTKVFNNIAKLNGGAFNNHTGRIDIRHATIQNNTSALGNGGAVFCEGPHANANRGLGYTIRLLCSDMVQNKTRGQDGTATDPTGRGGGIYLKYGSIYAHYSNILDNEANINGGGMDNHSGDILLYGCDVRGNRANEGGGGGIFTFAGDITTGPSTARDGLFNTSKYTIITNNTAEQDGGGINNQQGNITINGDIVANNTSTQGNGGGIYITDGIINMKGGRIDNNQAPYSDNENGIYGKGGGVYSGGGEFNIMEREANPDPIVLIVDTQVKRVTGGQNGVVHYHLVDQGKYQDVTNVEHGIVWGEGSPSIEVVYGSAAGINDGYSYEQGEPACERIIIPTSMIDDDKTYKVKAFFRYKTIENGAPVIKTGYSQTMEFVSYSDSPLVISGAVSNITKNSAEGSGKIMDAGGSSITARGVQIWKDGESPTNISSPDETEFFTVDLTGLDPNTTYYARAYATNSNGTSYGNTVEFKTLKDTPDMGSGEVEITTAVNDGVITVTASFTMPAGTTFGNNPGQVKGYGFIWSTDDDPELHQDHTVEGTLVSGTTKFTASYPNAQQGTCFYVRAYATYVENTVTQNSDPSDYSLTAAKQFFTPYVDGKPVVRATSISGITQNQATINCEIYSGYVSGTITTKYGVYVDNLVNNNVPEDDPDYGTHRFPSSNFVPQSTTPPNNDKGTYSVTLTGLTPGTTYYLKAYATNDNGANYSYGNGYNFTALPISQPNVVIVSITDIDKVSAKVNFTINNGGGSIGDKGVNYSLNSDMSGATSVSSTDITYDATTGVYTASLSGLTAHTTYYVQAYATNSAGTHTCQTVSFQTNFDKPSVVLDNLTNLVFITTPTVSLESDAVYTVTPYSASGATQVESYDYVKTYGVCWSTLHNPIRNESDVANTHFKDSIGNPIAVQEGVQITTRHMKQRFPNTRYWARAYASTATPNDVIDPDHPENNTYSLEDIVYSDEKAFLTLPLMESNGASNITSTSATLAGNIASRDPEHYLVKYGVCWGPSANPTPNNNPTAPNYLEYDITSASSTTRSFSFNATGLNPSTEYHYRAYAINRNGKAGTDFAFALDSIAYGPDVEFVTTPYTITATANPASAGSVAYTSGLTPGGGWDGSATFTLTASANTDWQFKDWTRDGETILTANPLTQTSSGENPDVNANDHTYLANFKARVSVAANGTGTVGITGQEEGTTEAYIDLNTSVTVTATPTTGSSASFLYWTDAAGEIIMGDDGETPEGATYTFILSAPVSLTAHFSIRNISVSAIPAEGGTVSGNGTYNNGESCTVSALANTGYVFLYWKEGDNVVSTDAEYTFTVSSDRTLTAYFGRTIAVSANNSEYGNVSGGGNYPVGAECTVTATPAEGYVFLNWTENNVVVVDGENNPVPATYTFTVSGNRTLVANFTSRGRGASRPSRPRDIYPAPAREPWDWDDDFRDGEPTTPIVATGAVTNVTATTATVAGTVTALGTDEEGATLSEAGIWYSTISGTYDVTNNPGTFVAATSAAVGSVYSVNLTGLSAEQTYYACAYAKNSVVADYGFGEATSFIYNNPTVTTGTVTNSGSTAIVTGTVTNNGSAALTEAGVWYSTSGNEYDASANPGIFKNATVGDGGAFSVTLTGLLADQTYYVRAYATNNNRQTFGFGEANSFTFANPTVVTGSVSNLTQTGATVSGTVTDQGSLTSLTGVTAGIWYSTIGGDYNPMTNVGTFQSVSSFTVGTEYSVNLTGLTATNTYYARACINMGTAEAPSYIFGRAVTFSHSNVVVATGSITDVTSTSATVKGNLVSEGAYQLSQIVVGVWYSTEGPIWDATNNQGVFTPASGTPAVGEFTVNLSITGFNQYVRAYAKVTTSGKADTYFFGNLTSIYANSPSVSNNDAVFGGGIYMTNNKPESPTLLVFSGGNSDEAKGRINLNYADRAGGGIYIDEHAYMQMTGYCEVNGNHVPVDSLGGGIYLAGRLYVGNPGDGPTDNSLKVNQNFAITDADFKTNYLNDQDGYTATHKFNRNNIYLPRDTYSYATGNNTSTDDDSNVITLLADISAKNTTTNTYYSNMGFSVPNGYCPVITTAAEFRGDYLKQGDENFSTVYEPWMSHLMPSYGGTAWSTSALFDDSESHIAIHTVTDIDPFRAKYIFLWGSWTNPKVDEDPQAEGTQMLAGDGTHYKISKDPTTNILSWEIYSPEGLSWFSSYINGLNAFATNALNDGVHDDFKYDENITPYATAKLMNDIDMSAAFWVPLGSVVSYDGSVYHDHDDDNNEHNFKGIFDGQGNIITGLDCRFLTGVLKYGLFGKLDENAVVKNVFIDDSKYTTIDQTAPYYVGGVAGIVSDGVTISASEARVVMDVNKSDKARSYVGGIAGQVKGTAAIHSSMAMPEIHGSVRYVGGLVGQLGSNCDLLNSFSNPKFPDASYQDTCWVSCHYDAVNLKWVADETAYSYFGGLVGENNGLVENCYSRLQGSEPIGNVNWANGNINNLNKSIFGWLVGTNKSTIQYCYAPRVANETGYDYASSFVYVKDSQAGTTLKGQDNYGTTQRYSSKYGFKHRDHQMKLLPGSNNTYEQATSEGKASANDTLVGGLQFTLNRWVAEKSTVTGNPYNKDFAVWTRTMASPINDDYPVPMLTDFNSVGSADSIYMHYKHNVDSLISAYTKLSQTKHPTPSIYLYDTIRNGSDILPIKKTNIGSGLTNQNVMLAINENLGILQDVPLKARVGVTIKNSRKDDNDYTHDPNWHLFSSAISAAPIGLHYHTSEEPAYVESIVHPSEQIWSHREEVWSNRNLFDPPKTTWFKGNVNIDSVGYFPTNTPYGTWRPGISGGHTASAADGFYDLYEYSEYYYHWINYKREGTASIQDHWHMDRNAGLGVQGYPNEHYRIGWDKYDDDRYFNDVTMPKGKGYMMALSSESMMMADGTLNMGNDITMKVTNTDINLNLPYNGHGGGYNYTGPWRSLNMLGNPYQSYLDFGEFVKNENNGNILCSKTGTIGTENVRYYTYYTRDDDNKEYVSHTTTQSSNPGLYTTSYIHPHQGFFVMVNQDGTLQFTESMRKAGTNTSLQSEFREEHLNYPLVNLFCYDASGERDFTTVEIHRPALGGGLKARTLKSSNALLYAYLEGNEYQIVFAPVGTNMVPVRFETEEDGVFTMKWNTLHGDFSYLHLIDHITGADVDCLTTDEYRFEGKESDYKSRFRLVFECTGLEENEDDGDSTGPTVFAFQLGDELMVNGEGTLQMFDVQGRCLLSTYAEGSQSTISLPKVAAGVYLLRLIGNNQVKVQKMVIK